MINIQQRFRRVIHETLALAQPNQMRERYVRALDISLGFGDFRRTFACLPEHVRNSPPINSRMWRYCGTMSSSAKGQGRLEEFRDFIAGTDKWVTPRFGFAIHATI